jgi:hypothetical protein
MPSLGSLQIEDASTTRDAAPIEEFHNKLLRGGNSTNSMDMDSTGSLPSLATIHTIGSCIDISSHRRELTLREQFVEQQKKEVTTSTSSYSTSGDNQSSDTGSSLFLPELQLPRFSFVTDCGKSQPFHSDASMAGTKRDALSPVIYKQQEQKPRSMWDQMRQSNIMDASPNIITRRPLDVSLHHLDSTSEGTRPPSLVRMGGSLNAKRAVEPSSIPTASSGNEEPSETPVTSNRMKSIRVEDWQFEELDSEEGSSLAS